VFEPLPGQKEIRVCGMKLQPGRRIGQWTAKAGYDRYGTEVRGLPDGEQAREQEGSIDARRIVNLSGKMDAEGRLRWEAPRGNWTILRVGYCPTGGVAIPVPGGGANGLDCDKFSRAAVEFPWQHAVMPFLAVKPRAVKPTPDKKRWNGHPLREVIRYPPIPQAPTAPHATRR